MTLQKKVFMSIVSLILVFSILSPVHVTATSTQEALPRASYYLSAYNTYICAVGNGDIEIWFEVMGTGKMDELGTLSIVLYESTNNSTWTHVKTFLHENYDSMLLRNDYWHMDCVSYDGVAGRYYKAYVCIWAGKNGSGDNRYMWATSVKAT